jgi:hypothetical protein
MGTSDETMVSTPPVAPTYPTVSATDAKVARRNAASARNER